MAEIKMSENFPCQIQYGVLLLARTSTGERYMKNNP